MVLFGFYLPKLKNIGGQEIALCIYPAYLHLARVLQRTYMLEPAGSHGVWSLDDYCFLPFLLGASQLSKHKHIRPRKINGNWFLDSRDIHASSSH